MGINNAILCTCARLSLGWIQIEFVSRVDTNRIAKLKCMCFNGFKHFAVKLPSENVPWCTPHQQAMRVPVSI